MNPMMNDEHFFDLAMKAIARQTTDAERAELDALLASRPELRQEFERLAADARVAKIALPLMDSMEATAGELPAYVRGRLQTKVRQTLGRPAAKRELNRSVAWDWRWILGLAATAAMVLLVALPMFRAPGGPAIQVAMLDTVGAVRGSGTNETEILKQQWKNSIIQSFDKTDLLENWETNWPGGNKVTAKVIYDRPAGEVRVLLRQGGKSQQTTFVIEQDLVTTIQEADNFIREQTKR
jgi:anti-sigma factor RsiW